MHRQEYKLSTGVPAMKKLEVQLLVLLMLSCFVGIVMFNFLTTHNSNDVTRFEMSLRELKEIIRSEIQRSTSVEKRITSLASKTHGGQPKGKVALSSRDAKVSRKRPDVIPPHSARTRGNDKPAALTPRRRYIVHLCDNTHACSGWGDRQKGVVAAYLLATVTNRVFVLNMTSPCSIRTFLQPNKYNWVLSDSELAGKSAVTIGGVRSTDYHRVIQTKDINTVYPQDVIYLRSNSDLVNTVKSNPHFQSKIPAWAKTSRSETFRNGWDILMKPTHHVTKHVNSFLHGVNLSREGDLVCAHVRIGKNPSVPNDSPNRNSVESVAKLWYFLQPYATRASRVFIATDSLDVRESARHAFGKKSLDTGGVILHIDRQRKSGAACDGFEMVIIEQIILTKCHVLVVSASNFSIRGAFIRGKRDNLFIFKNGTVTPFSLGSR